MAEKTPLQRLCSRSISYSLLIGAFIWLGLLLRGARFLHSQTHDAIYHVQLGPLLLTTISTKKAAGGMTAAFAFNSGMLWFAIGCVAIGGSIALLLWTMQTHHARRSSG